MFVHLLEGKVNYLKYCGITVTMPTAAAMAQASPDIIVRFQAIDKVYLSGMNNLAGELRGPRALPKGLYSLGNFSISPKPVSLPSTPLPQATST